MTTPQSSFQFCWPPADYVTFVLPDPAQFASASLRADGLQYLEPSRPGRWRFNKTAEQELFTHHEIYERGQIVLPRQEN